MRYLIVLSLAIGLIFVNLGYSHPNPSPAGGGYLVLDEEHDFVSTVRAWFPEGKFKELTAEAWIYIETPPDPNAFWSVIGQEDRFNLIIHGAKGGNPGAWVHGEGVISPIVVGSVPASKGRWVHIAAVFNANAGYGMNGMGGNWLKPGGNILESDKPLIIGGIIPQDLNLCHFAGEPMRFKGYIDEVRISDVARYVGVRYEVPKGRFEADEHTISLWHFDEGPESIRYIDASGNGYTLWRNGFFEIDPEDKVTTIWGKLKRGH